MRIYNLLKAPEGLSYDEIDYEAVYQSGYTAGFDSGVTDGYNEYECETEEPILYVSTNFPQDGIIPATGGVYTMTISGNSSWTSNTVNYSGPGTLCTLSPDSGAADESTSVTVTFPANNDSIQGLVELGVSPMPDTGYTQDTNYFTWQFRYETASATALTWQTETECGDIIYNLFTLENGQTIHTDVVPSPSGVSTNLVFTSTNSAITIDSNGNITRSGGTNFDEIEISVTDTISNITLSGSVFCEVVPYLFVLEPNDCPCEGVDYHNDCSCVPASGGTYHNQLLFEAPWNYNLTSVQLSSKPSWVTVSPSAWTICAQGAGDLTFTVEPCNEYASGTDTYRDGWVEFIGNDVSGLTGGFYIKQNKPEPPTVQKYVADLVDEGYANFIQSGGTYKGGNYVEILSSCPYDMSEIVDLEDVALNQKQLSGIQNTIVWNQVLPSGWNVEDIAAIYNGQSLNYTPRGEQFWAITSAVSSFTITYTGDTYVTSDYSWGSYNSEGVFAPRWNQNKQAQYIANGWLSTPESVTVNFSNSFSSVAQVMFSQMKGTRTLTINQLAGTFSCHDVTGMFEGNTNMETLNINGNFNWSTWRTCHNVFDGCDALTGIPYCSSWSREHANNQLYPHNDGQRGSANCRHIFNTPALEYLGPVFNMGAISLCGCTYDGRSQGALSDTLFNCPVLEDVLIKNLNNNDWNFTDNSTFTYIPSMNVASIEYLLNNVEDVTADPHTITLSTLHQGEISQAAIDNATSKGWTIAYA